MNIVYEKKTEKSLDEALAAVKENLQAHSFGVLFELNFKDKLAEKGLELADDYFVLEVCNPGEAKKVLEQNIHAGYVLPCKMVVRTEGKDTYIGMTSATALMSLYDEPELVDFAEGIEDTLRKAIEASI